MSEHKNAARGIILFAHGSADPRWKEPFMRLEKILSGASPGAVVRAAFLKECEPCLDDVVGDMTSAGVKKITIVPMFLAVGAHSAKDFPEISRRLEETYGGVSFEWTEVIGEWEETTRALAEVMVRRLG